MYKKILFGAMALAMAMTLSGCGNPSHGEGGPGPAPGNETTAAKGGNSPYADVCNYFPKDLIENAIGRPILKVEGPQIPGYTDCFYYTIWSETYDHTPYGDKPGGAPIVVTYDTTDVPKDKISNEKTGNKYVKDDSIPMDNYVVRDYGGTIWMVLLNLGGDKYIRINALHSAATGPELLKVGIKLAEKIQGK